MSKAWKEPRLPRQACTGATVSRATAAFPPSLVVQALEGLWCYQACSPACTRNDRTVATFDVSGWLERAGKGKQLTHEIVHTFIGLRWYLRKSGVQGTPGLDRFLVALLHSFANGIESDNTSDI